MSSKLKLQEIYEKTKYLSIKHDSYFPVYEQLLSRYKGKPLTIVEVGIFNGGSLFMWREYFGPDARIIGIDLNPQAKDWTQSGFEIYIGDQSSHQFWEDLFDKIGPIDVLIDDGGHTNYQQIVTAHHAIKNIKDGGVLIVEDVHTSYLKEFGNPFRYSFINFAQHIVNGVNSRASALKRICSQYSSRVYSVSFFESIVAFHIDSRICIQSRPTSNNGISKNAFDFRYHGTSQDLIFKLVNLFATKQMPIPVFFKRLVIYFLNYIQFVFSRFTFFYYKKYFKD